MQLATTWRKRRKPDIIVYGPKTYTPLPPSRLRLLIQTPITQENGKAHNKQKTAWSKMTRTPPLAVVPGPKLRQQILLMADVPIGPPSWLFPFRTRRLKETKLKRPNPLPADMMSAHERRTELYGLLATAVARLVSRDRDYLSRNSGDRSLHLPPKQSGTATPTHRRSA